MTIKCAVCMDTFWVCENHPAKPWDGPSACGCGGAGMPCPACNEHADITVPPTLLARADEVIE
jgi:hypothetical protein